MHTLHYKMLPVVSKRTQAEARQALVSIQNAHTVMSMHWQSLVASIWTMELGKLFGTSTGPAAYRVTAKPPATLMHALVASFQQQLLFAAPLVQLCLLGQLQVLPHPAALAGEPATLRTPLQTLHMSARKGMVSYTMMILSTGQPACGQRLGQRPLVFTAFRLSAGAACCTACA